MEFIPPDVMVSGIFCRLPIKSILQCKAVCKAWKKFLGDSNFANVYGKDPPFTTFMLFETEKSHHYHPVKNFCLLEISKNGGSCIQTPINPKFLPHRLHNHPSSVLVFKGSCNGLLCLVYETCYGFSDNIDTTIYIWNPITGEFMQLPTPKYTVARISYQFGYSSATNQFKVLIVPFKTYQKIEVFRVGVDVKWRCLRDGPAVDSYKCCDNGITLNGVYNWKLWPRRAKWIYTLDLGEEKYGRISSPPGSRTKDNKLKVLNDHLCVVDFGESCKTNFTLWTIAESWTKRIISTSWSQIYGWDGVCRPIARLGNGKVLFHDIVYHKPDFISRNTNTKVKVFEGRRRKLKMDAFAIAYSPCFSLLKDVINQGGSSQVE